MFISDAYAQSAGGGPSGFFDPTILTFVLVMVVMYFMAIRPQQKRAKETKAMIEALKSGDEVVTVGGMLGRVVKVADQYLTIDIGEGGSQSVEIKVQRSAVQTLLPKGTIKSV